MFRLAVERALGSLIVLLVMSFVIYGLMGLMPGDPIDLMITANPKITSADAAQLRELYGLHKPILERYGKWLISAMSGEFGYSRLHGQPVVLVMNEALLNTVILLGWSFCALDGSEASSARQRCHRRGSSHKQAPVLLASACSPCYP